MAHYLTKSRQVLEINDTKKLHKLLAEARAELMSQSIGFGKMRMTAVSGKQPIKNKKAIRNQRRHIARILTRLSQLRQQEKRE